VVGRIDVASEAAEGEPLELWLDSRRIQLFDAETGENLTRKNRSGSDPIDLRDQASDAPASGADTGTDTDAGADDSAEAESSA